MYLNPLYICVCIILFAAAFIFIIILQLQIIHLRAQQARIKTGLCEFMTLFINYLEEERNECQDRINEITNGFSWENVRIRKSRKSEKVYILSDKVRELLKK